MPNIFKKIGHFLRLRSFVAKTIISAIDSNYSDWERKYRFWQYIPRGRSPRLIVFSKRGFFCHLTVGRTSFSYGALTCFIIWLSFYLSSEEGKWLLEILTARMTSSSGGPFFSNHKF
jgi:hypothetical protein